MGSFGYGANGRQETVGARHRINIVSVFTIIIDQRLNTSKANTSPAVSIKSLPELQSINLKQPREINESQFNEERETDSIAKRRSKKNVSVKVFTLEVKTFWRKGGVKRVCNEYI
jgi:hypothetical protein